MLNLTIRYEDDDVIERFVLFNHYIESIRRTISRNINFFKFKTHIELNY